jgi:hypothetical protein
MKTVFVVKFDYMLCVCNQRAVGCALQSYGTVVVITCTLVLQLFLSTRVDDMCVEKLFVLSELVQPTYYKKMYCVA